jgi:hypothetical protein
VVVATTQGYRVQCRGQSWPCRPGRRATDPPGNWVTPADVIWVPDPAAVAMLPPAQ